MKREEKIKKLIKKSRTIGEAEDDEGLKDWLISYFSCVQYDFSSSGVSYTVRSDDKDCANHAIVCEDNWDAIDDDYIDYLLSL
uniref:Uncharacterized protein n=1 Tax=viral metagenome TaxID=1070528 RepID=A0A6M3JFG9_9ZZZZ